MAGNTFGKILQITTFGESHGTAVGVVIDGFPPGIKIDLSFVQSQLDKRKPGQSHITTQRKESDKPEIISGVFEETTTGAPITAIFKNEDGRAQDYEQMKNSYRPSHADFTYDSKYKIRDHRGGGRSSARETVGRVFAGSLALQYLKTFGIKISAYVSQVGSISTSKTYKELDLNETWNNPVHCPDRATAILMQNLIEETKSQGDTIGGVVSCVIENCPLGLGEPVFDRLSADLAKAMLSINATKGFEFGSGFSGVSMKGSDHNDPFVNENGKIKTIQNFSGGIQGGISNGMDIYFRVAFKPVATIMKSQKTVDKSGQTVDLQGRGRHDPCVVPRAVVIVESMAALVILDHFLRSQSYANSQNQTSEGQ